MAKVFTVRQLIDELEDYDEDMEIQILSQSDRYPMAYQILRYVEPGQLEDDENVLYLIEGEQVGYVGGVTR